MLNVFHQLMHLMGQLHTANKVQRIFQIEDKATIQHVCMACNNVGVIIKIRFW